MNEIIAEDRSLIKLEDGSTIPLISPEPEILDFEGETYVWYDGQPICPLGRKKALPNEYVHPEPGYTVGRCKMITRAGTRCGIGCRDGWTVCHKHGAGPRKNPGGLSNWHIQTGRFSASLPERLTERYEEFIDHPETLNMQSELALLDTRMSELLERLDTADTTMAWTKIRMALRRIDKEEIDGEDIDVTVALLNEALQIQHDDEKTWGEITKLVEQRRRLAETERRRVIDAQQVMTFEEANRFIAFILHLVQTCVKSSQERRAIADGMKKFTQGG